MLDPRTPVMPGGIALWEREVSEAAKAVDAAFTALAVVQARQTRAIEMLAALRKQREEQTR